MNLIRLLFSGGRSEQERVSALYQESLQEAETILGEIDANRPIAESARKRIPRIIKGLQHDGIQANAGLIQRLAETCAEGYIDSHWRDFGFNADRVRSVFRSEYEEAFEYDEEDE